MWLSGLGVILQSEGLLFESGQGTRLGCRPGSLVGGVQEAADPCFSPSLSPPLSENKIFFKKA